MAKTTHTGRGTCQVCGRIQAIDAGTMITAKHGYKVAGFGYFMGVCPGARYLPAEKSLDVTNMIMSQLEEAALQNDAHAAALQAFEVVTHRISNTTTIEWQLGAKKLTHYDEWDNTLPVVKTSRRGQKYNSVGGYVTHEITDKTPVYVIEREQHKAGAIEEANARSARSQVSMMREFIVPRLGKDLYPAKEVMRAERKAAKAKAVEGVRFPTKQSRKDALDRLSRAYDKARNELQGLYLALPNDKRTEAKTAVYYGPYQLSHWRAKHAEAALREFPEAASIVERITKLVAEREVIKTAI